MCNLLKNQTNTVIYLNYNDLTYAEALNSKIFLKHANFLNIPVLAYAPNAYATVD